MEKVDPFILLYYTIHIKFRKIVNLCLNTFSAQRQGSKFLIFF